jgi:hypothetical protein
MKSLAEEIGQVTPRRGTEYAADIERHVGEGIERSY